MTVVSKVISVGVVIKVNKKGRKGGDEKILKKQDFILADAHSTSCVVLWEGDTGKFEKEQMINFNTVVQEYNEVKYLR